MSILADVTVGQELPGFSRTFTRADLVRYAGASGDFNPIHWSNPAAAALGLPDVIAHGMLTMGTALRVVTDWAGDPGRVRSYYVRFTKPVVVPEAGGTEVRFAGTVTKVADGVATVSIEATCDEVKVLGSVTAEVNLG
ncbi:MAG: MaoC family dehydratase N-terminal domain-containing protein [Propionibacteriaceae bacterium]|nr:MaoC family dehydratase N-terminal domain-containing protein [Propionibacteriaceae bacterium]